MSFRAVTHTVCGGADLVSSHRKAQWPFIETWVRSRVTPVPRKRNRAWFRPWPCTSSMGEGIPTHQSGGSILSIHGPLGSCSAWHAGWVWPGAGRPQSMKTAVTRSRPGSVIASPFMYADRCRRHALRRAERGSPMFAARLPEAAGPRTGGALEGETQGKLHFPLRVCPHAFYLPKVAVVQARGDRWAGRGHAARILAGIQVAAGIGEFRRVGEVVDLGAELANDFFRDVEVLEQRCVRIPIRWTNDAVAVHCARGDESACLSIWIDHHRVCIERGVEPLVQALGAARASGLVGKVGQTATLQ